MSGDTGLQMVFSLVVQFPECIAVMVIMFMPLLSMIPSISLSLRHILSAARVSGPKLTDFRDRHTHPSCGICTRLVLSAYLLDVKLDLQYSWFLKPGLKPLLQFQSHSPVLQTELWFDMPWPQPTSLGSLAVGFEHIGWPLGISPAELAQELSVSWVAAFRHQLCSS